MDIWFCSDLHLGHSNIIKYCGRPFRTLDEMDFKLIFNFNQRVKEEDMVFYLGDFCFKYAPHESPNAPKNAFNYYRNQLKCKNIIFLKGNHDRNNSIKTPIQSITILYGGKNLFLTHNPKYAKPEYALNLCGHVHEKWLFKRLTNNSIICNLSVEQWNYHPVSFNEINQALSTWTKNEK